MSDESKLVKLDEKSDIVPAKWFPEDQPTGWDEEAKTSQVPYLNLLQGLSKPVCGDEEELVEGARPGRLYNSGTGQLYDEVVILPAMEQVLEVEWIPRDRGGGFVARHSPTEPWVKALRDGQKIGKIILPQEGHELVKTLYLWAVRIENGEVAEPIVVPITSTKWGPYGKWRKQAGAFTLELDDGRKKKLEVWHSLLWIGTRSETKKGNNYFNFVIRPAEGGIRNSLVLDPGDRRSVAARLLRESVAAGTAKLAEEKDQETEPEF